MGDEFLVGEVFGVVDLNVWVLFKGGSGNVVVIVYLEDGGVGVEFGEDGVFYLGYGEL